MRAVLNEFLDPHLGIDPPENLFCDVQTGYDASLARHNFRGAPAVGIGEIFRRHVTPADVLGERQGDEIGFRGHRRSAREGRGQAAAFASA